MSDQNTFPSIEGQMEQVRRQLETLTHRLSRVETHLGLDATGTPSASDQRPTTNDQRPTAGIAPSPLRPVSPSPARPLAPSRPPTTARTTGEWERLIGGKWALWVGSVAVFLAVAFFLAYTWHYLSHEGRLGIGFLAGMAFLGAGHVARNRVESWFGEGLAGGGLAILYLTIWTGAQRYGLLPLPLAFALMAAVSASGVALSLRYDVVSLSVLAAIGGFLTPLLIRAGDGGQSQPVPLLTYLALLNAGLLAVSLLKRWRDLTWLCFAATLFLVAGWAAPGIPLDQRWTVFAFVTLYFLLFLGVACFHGLARGETTDSKDLLLLFANAFAYAIAGQALLTGMLGGAPGAFALVLAVAFGLLSGATRRVAPENNELKDAALGAALFFLTIAAPIQLRQGWLAVGWSLQGTVLITLGLKLAADRPLHSRLLHQAGQIVWTLSLPVLAAVAMTTEPARAVPLLNARALPLLVAVIGVFWLAVRTRPIHEAGAPERWVDELTGVYAACAALGGAWLIGQETHLAFSAHPMPSAATWEAGARCATATLLAGFALGVFLAGLRLRHRYLRAGALLALLFAALLPASAGQLYATDGWTPFLNLRWLAYLAVGAAMAWIVRESHRPADPADADLKFLARVGVVATVLALLWGVTLETHEAFRYYRDLLGAHWDRAAQMGISLVWSVGGALLLIGGVVRRSQPIRLVALALLGVTVFKVFLFDLGFLDTTYRILSFAALGLALIGISWLYSRYGVGEAKS